VDVHFVVPELRRLDELKIESLFVPFFSDERPLRGSLGSVDWRLCGRISRMIERGIVTGAKGETVLVPARPRLPFEKIFLYGLGAKEDFDFEGNDAAVDAMLSTLSRARVRASVLVLPGRSVGLVTPTVAMEAFLRIAEKHAELDAVTLVEDAEAQKAMLPIVERERRRARASAS
jgi:hypothetical protein